MKQNQNAVSVTLIIKAPYGANFMTIIDFSISRWKNWPLSRSYFCSWEHALVALAVVERWPLYRGLNKESMYGLSVWFDCTQTAVVLEYQ